jgi:hypothetical protein
MQFILTGFSQDMGFRVFAFEGIKADRTRARYTVRADLALVRKYQIPVQELPLLCRALLDKRGEDAEKRALIFSEDEMQLWARDCALARATAATRKPPRRPAAANLGGAWRGPRP